MSFAHPLFKSPPSRGRQQITRLRLRTENKSLQVCFLTHLFELDYEFITDVIASLTYKDGDMLWP